jgi:hypothetical protein
MESNKDALPYNSPMILPIGDAAELTRGDGDLYTDSLGNTSTHYGKADQTVGHDRGNGTSRT